MPAPQQSTEIDPRLPLNLSRYRRGATVSWTDGRGARSVALTGAMVLGSSDAVPLSVQDARVSRLHAELTLDDTGVWLRDLGSRNGTWVDGLRVDRVCFQADGRFQVGGLTVELAFAREAARVPLWPQDRLGALLGRSEVMRELFMQISRLAASEAPVLVQGETGTGKELVAQEIHQASRRSAGPLVVVDCASLPESLLEAELFGHVRGSFTGAVSNRPGAIAAADGGTVFLDEIGELPLAMQPKLLRVLESRTVRRVGEAEQRPVDVRFISATHRDLGRMVAEGQFREDLYFRLSVLPLRVPPLRERLGDVPLLTEHFLAGRLGHPLDEAALATLTNQRWPGNVRELRSFAERAVALGVERALGFLEGKSEAPRARVAVGAGLPPVDVAVPFKDLREQWVEHLEREYLAALVAKLGRNAGTLADAAGLDRSYINRLLKKHAL